MPTAAAPNVNALATSEPLCTPESKSTGIVSSDHLDRFVGTSPDALLFPAVGGGHMAPATLYRWYYTARDAAGRPDLRWHDLHHSGAVWTAQTGATLKELMARLGHSAPQAALRYQHVAEGRDQEIARRLSAMAAAADGDTADNGHNSVTPKAQLAIA